MSLPVKNHRQQKLKIIPEFSGGNSCGSLELAYKMVLIVIAELFGNYADRVLILQQKLLRMLKPYVKQVLLGGNAENLSVNGIKSRKT